jgi:hypothetical protein
MEILGGWALTNIAVSTPFYFRTEDETRAFHEMNVAWNMVNLGIATAGFLGTSGPANEPTLDEALQQQRRLESALLLNIGLDLAYMAAGWALLERGARPVEHADRWTGYGQSLLLQGGFLLVFDLFYYRVIRRHRPSVNDHRR